MDAFPGPDGVHWPLMMNVPGEAAGPDSLLVYTNHELLTDSEEDLAPFLLDEAYVAAGGTCKQVGPPSPKPGDMHVCTVCSHVYNPERDGGGKRFEDLPADWRCPRCGSPKAAYTKDSNGVWHHDELTDPHRPRPEVPSVLAEDPKSRRSVEYTYSP